MHLRADIGQPSVKMHINSSACRIASICAMLCSGIPSQNTHTHALRISCHFHGCKARLKRIVSSERCHARYVPTKVIPTTALHYRVVVQHADISANERRTSVCDALIYYKIQTKRSKEKCVSVCVCDEMKRSGRVGISMSLTPFCLPCWAENSQSWHQLECCALSVICHFLYSLLSLSRFFSTHFFAFLVFCLNQHLWD